MTLPATALCLPAPAGAASSPAVQVTLTCAALSGVLAVDARHDGSTGLCAVALAHARRRYVVGVPQLRHPARSRWAAARVERRATALFDTGERMLSIHVAARTRCCRALWSRHPQWGCGHDRRRRHAMPNQMFEHRESADTGVHAFEVMAGDARAAGRAVTAARQRTLWAGHT
jgi:hypothetical protein